MPYADLADVRLYYEARGEGEPIVFVHGDLGTGAFHWRKQLASLPERYRVIAPDLRGPGRSNRVPFGPDIFRREAADLVDFAELLGLKQMHLVGFSAGGMPARCVPIERPDLVATLTLVSTADRLAGPVWAQVRHLLAVETREPKSAQLLAELHGSDDWEAIRDARLSALAAFAHSTDGDPTGGRLAEIGCPVLLVRGEHDPIMSPDIATRLASYFADVEVIELPGGTHFVPQSSPEWFNARLLAWLERHPIATASGSQAAPVKRGHQPGCAVRRGPAAEPAS